MESPSAGSSPEGVKYKMEFKVQCLRNVFQVLSSHRICKYYEILFVVNHEERVIVRTRIGVQKFLNGSNGTEWRSA